MSCCDSGNDCPLLQHKIGKNKCLTVAANRENDTCFGVGLVTGITDRIVYEGSDKILLKSFARQFGPLPDTLQTGACIFLSFSNVSFQINMYHLSSSYLWVNMGCGFRLFVSGPLLQRSHIGRPPFMGSDLGVPSL